MTSLLTRQYKPIIIVTLIAVSIFAFIATVSIRFYQDKATSLSASDSSLELPQELVVPSIESRQDIERIYEAVTAVKL